MVPTFDPSAPRAYTASPMFESLPPFARDAKSWPFEQARALLARTLKLRLETDADRDLAATLIDADKAGEAVQTLPALQKPVVFLE